MPNFIATDKKGEYIEKPTVYLKNCIKAKHSKEYSKKYPPIIDPNTLIQKKYSTSSFTSIFKSCNSELSKVQIFLFKVLHNKLPTCSFMHSKIEQEKLNLKNDCTTNYDILDLVKVYNSPNCPLCGHFEDTLHLASCTRTSKVQRSLPPKIINIINHYIDKSNKTKTKKANHIKTFPIWYGVHSQSYTSYQSKKFRDLANSNCVFGTLGFIPTPLTDCLEVVGINEKHWDRCTLDIQIAIIENLEERWRKRCKILWENTK
jgi:hypothetical protein